MLLSSWSFVGFAKNMVIDSANTNAIQTCQAAIKKIAEFTIKDRTHATHSTWSTNDANHHLFTSMTILSYGQNDSHLSITASPNPAGTCDITYTETFIIDQPCTLVRSTTFQKWQKASQLNNSVLLVNSNGSVTIYLTPQLKDEACLISKKEVRHKTPMKKPIP